MKPVVAIVGRPNVGKSTLFNRIAGKNRAIVNDLPGVTRDRNYLDVAWEDKIFTLVDTGGFDPAIKMDIARLVREQAQLAVAEADVILLLMDARDGLQHADIELTRMLQKTGKPVFYTVNKVEGETVEANVTEFYRLGVQPVFTISAKHKLGTTELMQEVVASLPCLQPREQTKQETVVSIIGRPNVGKSSLINRIMGFERLLVSEIPGTTRDSIDILIKYKGKTIRLIDTAGIRRKSRVHHGMEKQSIMGALRSISRSAICLLVIDAAAGVADQDAKLAAEIYARARACIVVINKWDLVAKNHKTYDGYIREVFVQLPFLDFAPALCVSALTGRRVRKILELIDEVRGFYERQVSTAVLNKVLREVHKKNPLPRDHGRTRKIYYGTQISTAPPSFVLFTNTNPQAIPAHYMRFLERNIREKCNLKATPVCLRFQARPKRTKP